MKIFSKEASKIIYFMVREMSSMKYAYKNVFEGCFDAAIMNHGYTKPTEDKEDIINHVISIINNIDKEDS